MCVLFSLKAIWFILTFRNEIICSNIRPGPLPLWDQLTASGCRTKEAIWGGLPAPHSHKGCPSRTAKMGSMPWNSPRNSRKQHLTDRNTQSPLGTILDGGRITNNHQCVKNTKCGSNILLAQQIMSSIFHGTECPVGAEDGCWWMGIPETQIVIKSIISYLLPHNKLLET